LNKANKYQLGELSVTYLYEFLSLGQWNLTAFTAGLFCLAAFIIGLSKTGLPGAGIVAIPVMAMIFPPKISVGIVLPLFIFADLFSVSYWWRYTERRYCFPYLLFVGLGVCGASFVVGAVDNQTFGVIIGSLILFLITLTLLTEVLRKRRNNDALPLSPAEPTILFSAFFGFAAGLISALSNAAGSVMSLYMILLRLDKFQFLGTMAVCAFFMNWAKVPLFLSIGSITADTLKLNVIAIPMVALGALAGIAIAKIIPQKIFTGLILVLTFAASLGLILR